MKLLSACLSLLLPNAAVLGEKGLTWPHRPNDISEDFGHDMLKYFMMRPGYTNLNNGAFGTGCKDAYKRQHDLDNEMEMDLNDWFRGGYQEKLNSVRQRLANYINCNATDLVMVENASTGANAVLRSLATSLNLGKGDKILLMNVAYPMIVNVCNYLAAELGATVVTTDLANPIKSDADILDALKETLQANPEIKFASMDWIASYPAVLLPIKEIVSLLHEHNIFVFVDAAHTLGHIQMDLKALGADALTSNCHKWLNSPKSGAVLYVSPAYQDIVVPAVISSEFEGSFVDKFEYTGTRSYNAMIAVDAAMDFRDKVGGDARIMPYLKQLAWDGAQACAAVWQTSLVTPNQDMNAGIVDVVLPTQDASEVGKARAGLLEKYDTYIQTSTYLGQWYVRLSAQIYLEVSDMEIMCKRFTEFY